MSGIVNTVFYGLIGALLISLALVNPAQAQNRDQEIRQLLEQRDREIKQVLGDQATFTTQQRDQLKDLINGVIDFEAMGRMALGPHWKDLSAAERSEFIDVFSAIVRSQSLSDLDIYRSTVTYEQIDVEGDSAFVRTTTVYKDVPAQVEYVLGYTDDKGWQAHDIILDDVSTVDGYARSFQTMIRKRGFATLMERLQKKLDSMETSS